MWDRSEFRTDFPTNRPLLNTPMKGREIAVATSKVKHTRSPYLNDWLNIRSLLPEDRWKDVKITLIAPPWWHMQVKDGKCFSKQAYESDDAYLKDVSAAVREEIMTLYDAGV